MAFDGFTLSKENETSVIAAFVNGFVLTVTATAGRLDLSLQAPIDLRSKLTRGLFGVFNGDPTDDLTPVRKDGTNGVPLSTTGSSERSIYDNFAESWRTPMVRKIFYYHKGTSRMTYGKTNFRPSFSDEILPNYLSHLTAAETAKINSTCKDIEECLFDLALTKNEQFAASTREQIERNVFAQKVLAKGNPMLDGLMDGDGDEDLTVNATVGKPVTFRLTAEGDADDDPSDVVIKYATALPVGAVFKRLSQQWYTTFSWTPRNTQAVALSFVAVDKHGSMSAEVNVNINMCDCSGHGTCLFDQLAYGQYDSSTFRVVACQCDVGWAGDFCEKNFDACADSPCTMGTTCSDAHPVEQVQTGKAFFCSKCPEGYTRDYEICVDLNECELQTRHDCSQLCMNVPEVKSTSGRVSCSCRSGYKLATDGATCTDLDECALKTAGCNHICNNTVGGYVCSCYGGFALKDDRRKCQRFPVNHCASQPCQHHGTCQNLVSGYKCLCVSGYTGMTCEIVATPCASNPCMHGSKCMGDSKKYSCQCTHGYFGRRCEYELDECLSYPCENGGTCLDKADRYYCVCPRGLAGDNCHRHVKPCSSNPCANGGTCGVASGSPHEYVCGCRPGYTGPRCQHANRIQTSIKFRIVNMTYEPDLGNTDSTSYINLARDLKSKLEAVYKKSDDVGPHFIEVTDIVFSNGSVIVDCTLSLRVNVSQSVLDSVLKQAIRDKSLLPHYELSVISTSTEENGTTYVTSTPQTEKRSTNRAGVIVGSVFGVALVLGLAAAAVFVFRRWHKGDKDDMAVEMVTNGDDDVASTT